jgi:hypothetical protein
MTQEPKYKFWDVLRDKASGWTGICLAVTFYATGCIHYGLSPNKLTKDGDLKDWLWFDESRLELIKASKIAKVKKPSSGNFPNPPPN